MPLLSAAFGTAEVTLILLSAVKAAVATAVITYASYKVAEYINEKNDNEENLVGQQGEIKPTQEKQEKKESKEFGRGGPPRQAGTGDYLPDPAAAGSPHSTFGTRIGGDRKPYQQGATFNEEGEFIGRIDVTDHGRKDHPNPHFHPASAPNAADTAPQPIKTDWW